MKLLVGGAVLTVLLLCANARPAKYEPRIAMVCGKVAQHVDLATGEWVADSDRSADCLKEKEDILAYCRKVYPDHNITNIIEEVQKLHIATWCTIGSSGSCKGHAHNVAPVRCIVGNYQTSPLLVPGNCKFEHRKDDNECHGPEYWFAETRKICDLEGKALSDPKMLEPCDEIDTWVGVQFLCCDVPTKLHKPKPNKGNQKLVPTPTLEVVKKQDVNPICLQPRLIGLCRALLPAWHYDADSGECLFFHYGGCGGNDNNFDSLEKCEQACTSAGKISKRKDDICGLPSEVGVCRAFFPRWFYDSKLGECQTFVYGGCGGNDNRFMQKDDCETKCRGYKEQTSVSVPSAESPPLVPIGVGPVLFESMPPMEIKKTTTTTATQAPTASTISITYDESTDLDSEHNLFVNKLDALKSEHKAKVTKVLGKWDADKAKLKLSDQQEDLENLEMDLQMTISSLEDEYDAKINKLNQIHTSRMDEMLADERKKTLQRFLDQLDTDSPKVRPVLSALEKYIDVEIADKTHTLQHLTMAHNDEFNGVNIPELEARLTDIERRVNSTRSKLDIYPSLLEIVRTDVDNLLSKIPPTPEEDPDDDDDMEEEVVNFLDETELGFTTFKPIKIDDGGLEVESDDYSEECAMPLDVGPCDAYFPRFFYDSLDNSCKEFGYGGCIGNKNNFKTKEECVNSCVGPWNDDNSIANSFVLDEDDEFEDESNTNQEVDKMFDYRGDLKPEFDVKLNGDPQALVSETDNVEVKYGGVGSTWPIWLGVALLVAMLLALGFVLARKFNSSRPPSRVVVETGEESTKELTLEEKQLLQLQQNGYENPTYKFFEKQIA